MIKYTFSIENQNRGFKVTEATIPNIDTYPYIDLYEYNKDIIGKDIIIQYQENQKIYYHEITANLHFVAVTSNNVFEFNLFTLSSLVSITILNPEFFDYFDMYIYDEKITEYTTTYILPKRRAIPCKLERKKRYDGLLGFKFSYPIYLKSFKSFWSVI